MPLPASVQPLSLVSHIHMDPIRMAELLRRKVAGQPFPYTFIHEVSPYSAAPEDLVRGREHAPGTGQAGDGRGMAWYFCGAANCFESAGGAPRRNRQVGGGGERMFWHPEGRKRSIPGEAYKRTLSYVLKVKSRPGASKSFRNKRLGWCMLEVGLEQHDGGAGHQDQFVLCKVYRSPRSMADPAETSTSAVDALHVVPAAVTGISAGVEGRMQHGSTQEPGPLPEEPLHEDMAYRWPRRDAETSVRGGGMPCPACERDNQLMQAAMDADSRGADSYISETHISITSQTTRQSILSRIELKRNVTILDIEKTSTLEQDPFMVEAISIFRNVEYLGMYVDWESTSEGKMSLTLVPSEMLNQESIQLVLDSTVQDLTKIATVDQVHDRSVISLTGYPHMSMAIFARVLYVLESSQVLAERFSPVSSKMKKVSLVVHDSVAEHCVHVLRSAFEINHFNGISMDNIWAPPPPPPQPMWNPPMSGRPMPVWGECSADFDSDSEVESPAWVERSADFVSDGEVESEEEEEELTETDESGNELGSATEEMEERSRRESITKHDGGDLCGSSEPGIWEICGWVRRLAIAKPSLPSPRRANNDSLCSRLVVWLTRFCAKQNSAE